MPVSKNELQVNWATHDAAKYACLNWHYSRCLPVGKLVKVGAWESGKFIGVVIFARGANYNMGKSFGLQQVECVELVRIALTSHKVSVSRVVSLALKFLKRENAKLRLIVSYADPEQGHHGGIYQAGNWIYKGLSSKAVKVFYNGKWSHKKTVDDAGVDQRNLRKKKVQGKYIYIMPLDKEMREHIMPMAKPYPKRVTKANSGDQPESGGAVPTDTLQS